MFRPEASRAEMERVWQAYGGKWVRWTGQVYEVEPKVKPSRIIFLYHLPVSKGLQFTTQFAAKVQFGPSWAERLRELAPGQRVAYEGQLIRRETGGWGSDLQYGLGLEVAGILFFENAELVKASSVPSPGGPSAEATPSQTPTATKADLVKALKDLQDAMLKKIDSDVEVTAIAFTDVKDYWRSKRWADIFKVPLRIIEDTIGLLKAAKGWTSIAKEADRLLDSSEANWQAASLVMMLHGLKEQGGQLQLAIDGPAYASSVKNMLEAADATYVPPVDKNWREKYEKVIKNHLYGVAEDTPLAIPRKSTAVTRKNVESASGALQVSKSIDRKFDSLLAEIEKGELPKDFQTDKVIAQLKDLTTKVLTSNSRAVDDIAYETYLADGSKYVPQRVQGISLGAVRSRYTLFGQTGRNLDKKLEIEASIEAAKALTAVGNVVLLYSNTYKVEGSAEKIRVLEKVILPSELALKGFTKIFYPHAEDQYYMLPQEMVFALPRELSNLWMIADDTDQYLRYLVGTLQGKSR